MPVPHNSRSDVTNGYSTMVTQIAAYSYNNVIYLNQSRLRRNNPYKTPFRIIVFNVSNYARMNEWQVEQERRVRPSVPRDHSDILMY